MSVLAIQNFDSLNEMQAVTTSSLGGSPWSVYSNATTAPVAQADSAAHGSRGVYIAPADGTVAVEWHETQATTATRVISFYFRILVDGEEPTYLSSLIHDVTDNPADWRINANRTVTMRSNYVAVGGASSQSLSMNTWYRAEWMTGSTGQELRIYEGESTTLFISRSGTLADSHHDAIACGITARPSGHSIEIDTIRIADDWVGPFGASSPDPDSGELLVSESFEEGSDGATITSSNSSATAASGVAATFTSSSIEGGLAAKFDPAGSYSQLQFYHEPTYIAWYSFYIYLPLLPTSPTYIASFNSSYDNNKVGDVRVNTNGTISLRDNNTAVLTSTAVLTAGQWHRIAVRIEPGATSGLRLRMYLGDNRHGSTPDYEGSGSSSREYILSYLLVGVVAASDMEILIDRVQASSTAEPVGMTGNDGSDPIPISQYVFYDSGAKWHGVTQDLYYDTGTDWLRVNPRHNDGGGGDDGGSS